MHTGFNLHPTFENAQALYNLYSTLQSNANLKNGLVNIIDSVILNTFNTENTREVFNKIILRYYPNEISIKSNFINQILFKSNNHVTIFELPIGNSRIDLCKLNGSSVAYEIKTDLDNLSRLNKQLNDYLEIFEKVYVICSINRIPEVERHIMPDCGIYTYSISKYCNYRFQLYRNAIESLHINPAKQLNILQKQEHKKYFSDTSLTNRKDIITFILQQYSSSKINEIFKHAIKARYKNQWDFLKNNKSEIFEIDYQWFFKNNVNPTLIYS